MATENKVNPQSDYEFANLSPAEVQDLKAAEDKINHGKSEEVIILAYEKK